MPISTLLFILLTRTGKKRMIILYITYSRSKNIRTLNDIFHVKQPKIEKRFEIYAEYLPQNRPDPANYFFYNGTLLAPYYSYNSGRIPLFTNTYKRMRCSATYYNIIYKEIRTITSSSILSDGTV